MNAVFSRELCSYFVTPMGYIYLAVFWFFAGFYFTGTCLVNMSASLSYVFANLFNICLFLIPVLTMRLVSEERKAKNDQLLLTCPLRLPSLVLGKFLAAYTIFLTGTAITLVFGIIISFFAHPDWPVIAGNFIGLALLGAALISIALFISAHTENQIIAAVGGFAAGLFFLLSDAMVSVISEPLLKRIFSALSLQQHYNSFTLGLLNTVDIVFFLSITAAFLLLTMGSYECRRWR